MKEFIKVQLLEKFDIKICNLNLDLKFDIKNKIPIKIFTFLTLFLADIKYKISCKRYPFDKCDN